MLTVFAESDFVVAIDSRTQQTLLRELGEPPYLVIAVEDVAQSQSTSTHPQQMRLSSMERRSKKTTVPYNGSVLTIVNSMVTS